MSGLAEENKMKEYTRIRGNIEPYNCEMCGRLFYIDPQDKNSLYLGCPYGCDNEQAKIY